MPIFALIIAVSNLITFTSYLIRAYISDRFLNAFKFACISPSMKIVLYGKFGRYSIKIKFLYVTTSIESSEGLGNSHEQTGLGCQAVFLIFKDIKFCPFIHQPNGGQALPRWGPHLERPRPWTNDRPGNWSCQQCWPMGGLKINYMKRNIYIYPKTDIATLWKNRPRADSLKMSYPGVD